MENTFISTANENIAEKSPSISQHCFGTYCLAASWLIGTVFAFWVFLASDYRNFYPSTANQLAIFEKTNFSNKLEAYIQTTIQAKEKQKEAGLNVQGYVFHFWNPGCQCDRFNRPHVEKLISTFGPKGFHFYIVPTKGETLSAQRWQSSLKEMGRYMTITDESLAHEQVIPAGPAAAVLDNKGKLAYFGPYSLGGVCKADDNGLIENALNKISVNSRPLQMYSSGFGCFCSWK